MGKKISATLYMTSKLSRKSFVTEYDDQGYLFSDGIYRTKILPEDLPEWFVRGYLYKRHGFISAKGVKYLFYVPNYNFDNHLYKYDSLLISYGTKIVPYESEDHFAWFKGYDHVIGGPLIVSYVDAAEKFSGYDVREIRQELVRKRVWYDERNPKA